MTLWKALWQTQLEVIAWLDLNCHSVQIPAHPHLSTLTDATVASTGTCHCSPEWHNFPLYCHSIRQHWIITQHNHHAIVIIGCFGVQHPMIFRREYQSILCHETYHVMM